MKENVKPLVKKLGERITKQRAKRGITLEKLAYETGISKGNLSDIEHGKRDSRYSTLRIIAGGLGISVSQLLKDL